MTPPYTVRLKMYYQKKFKPWCYMVNFTKFMIHMHMPMAGLVLERTQKIRTSNTRTLAFPNFKHLELIPKMQVELELQSPNFELLCSMKNS